MLPSLVEQPPEGDGWLHEIKFDGYRTQLVIDAGRVRSLASGMSAHTNRTPAFCSPMRSCDRRADREGRSSVHSDTTTAAAAEDARGSRPASLKVVEYPDPGCRLAASFGQISPILRRVDLVGQPALGRHLHIHRVAGHDVDLTACGVKYPARAMPAQGLRTGRCGHEGLWAGRRARLG